MTNFSSGLTAAAADPLTPTGLQSSRTLAVRRAIVAILNLGTLAVLAAAMARLCQAGGWTLIDALIFACFLGCAPWSILCFWNATIGMWLLHVRRDAMALVAPFASAGDSGRPVGVTTAVVMTLRNEDAVRALGRLQAIKRSLDGTGSGAEFSYFVLSDTNDPRVATDEEAAFADWQAMAGSDAGRLVYRRRIENIGYKAGNIRDFCRHHGADFEFMLVLDADSFMSGETIVRMIRIGEAHPRIGILQSLVVGLPSPSAFARIFQFGMRHGMRPYSVGSAWWAGDCGQFWGHNALVRIAPFLAGCELPVLPGRPPLGGHVLSHDQVEAALMRRAGYEVRVLPEETGSYEDNPPDLIEFTRRDLRWCQGNMQYGRLLGLPGLRPMSRFQLFWAMMMFLGLPASTLIVLLAALKTVEGVGAAVYPTGLALVLYLGMLFLIVAPKLAGFLDTALTQGAVRRYGGAPNFAAGCSLELVVSFLTGPVTAFRTSLFMAGLLVGRSVGWRVQARDARLLSWSTAARAFWPQTLFGVLILALFAAGAPHLIVLSLPFTAAFVLAIPVSVATADPMLGKRLARMGICATPEEICPPPEINLLKSKAAAPAFLSPSAVPASNAIS
ncbi:MAG: glucans biosynthesis glucosyltransferase MdoH [Methylobacteriaceae bacterium]|nr:glucans biosynthesis glucosyltransferase MdoH [Methylobacteriaceae bacterium]